MRCGFPPLMLAIGLTLASAATAKETAPTATIDTGTLRGTQADGVTAFKGVPFAAPPVGALRWRAPQPAATWRGTRDASRYGHDCMQKPFPSDAAPLGTPPAEDCLYANVWRPAGAAKRLPVMVWIYGGGFVNGGSSPPDLCGRGAGAEGYGGRQFQLPARPVRHVRPPGADPRRCRSRAARRLRLYGPARRVALGAA